jgi:hypothetical protein
MIVWACPVCGHEVEDKVILGGSMTVQVEGHEGHYCMNCWAVWVAKNIPRMIKLQKVEGIPPPAPAPDDPEKEPF